MNHDLYVALFLVFLDPGVVTASLASRALDRLWQDFRPATLLAYKRLFGLILAFLVALDLSLPQITTLDVLAFMEYLLQSGISAANITNHITAVKSLLMIYNGDASVFRDHRIPLFIKINRPLNPVFKTLIDEELLLAMILACDGFQHPLIFKALYLFSYF